MKNSIEAEEYAPLNLWIRQDQMDNIAKEAYEKGTTIYSLIRRIIDFYYENNQWSINEV